MKYDYFTLTLYNILDLKSHYSSILMLNIYFNTLFFLDSVSHQFLVITHFLCK